MTMGPVSFLMLPGLLLLDAVQLASAAPTEYLRSGVQRAGRFWHVTDLHLDPSYHLTEDPTQVCYSSKGVPATNPGPYGDFLCDSPFSLIQSAFSHISEADPRADFMIWTGDSPPHVPARELSTDMVVEVMSNMTQNIRDYFPTMPVYPALGNHDYWPQDQMPSSTNDIYQAAAKLWAPWLQPAALLTLREGGFYSQLVWSGLRVISLNTILYYSPNEVTANMSDPAGQFQWLQSTLEGAAQSKEKVFIIGHVPVGYLPYARDTTAMRERDNERLVAIFRNYSQVIAGQFYGHTHRDSVMVLLDLEGKPVNSLFVSPAVTPIKSLKAAYSNNPALRLYQYDPVDYTMLDIWQYYLNLTEANRIQRAEWKLEYIMTQAFGLKDLQPQSLLELALSFTLPQTNRFQRYFSHFMVAYNDSVVCDGHCKLIQVCSVLYLDHNSYSKCVGKRTQR